MMALPPFDRTSMPFPPETPMVWLPVPKLPICAELTDVPAGATPDERTSMPPPDAVMVWFPMP
jgi:hypothetical protein